jgi:hypothetical protein
MRDIFLFRRITNPSFNLLVKAGEFFKIQTHAFLAGESPGIVSLAVRKTPIDRRRPTDLPRWVCQKWLVDLGNISNQLARGRKFESFRGASRKALQFLYFFREEIGRLANVFGQELSPNENKLLPKQT